MGRAVEVGGWGLGGVERWELRRVECVWRMGG